MNPRGWTLEVRKVAGSEYNDERRNDLAMRNRRRFSLEFKRQVVEELMRGESGPAQLCRKYDVCASLLYHWKDMYCGGRFNNAPTQEGAVRDRVDKLERLVGGERGFKKGIAEQSQPVCEKRQGIGV